MSKRLPTPCAQWAERLSQASFGQLSNEEGAVLKAHLSVCPACAAARAEYLRAAALLRQAPDPDPLPGLPPSLLRVWAAEAGAWRVNSRREAAPPSPPARAKTKTRFLDRHTRPLQEISMQTLDNETSPAFPSKPSTWRQRAGRRTITVMSALAAVLVIGLVAAALVASHLPGKSSGTGTGQKATTTSTLTRPINQQWQVLPHLTDLPVLGWNWTALAPSDPSVVYQIANGDQVSHVSLRRSDDQGATWKNLPAPEGAQERLGELYISPTNARHVLALAQKECSSGQASVAGPLSILSDGNSCSVVYFSNNGGESWALVTLPAHGSHNLFMGSGIFAQENRLYAILDAEPGITASELVMSSNDGATWQFADQGLMAEQHCLQGLAVPSTGTTLYATTLSYCGNEVSGADTAQIWRSDNAGAQWTSVSTMSAIDAFELRAVNVSDQSQPVLIDLGQPGDSLAQQFSLDNGKTWQPIPALGTQGTFTFPLAILHDGSLLAQSKDGFYAWKAGESSWHKVAPALAGIVNGSLVVFDQTSGKETLYLEVRPDQGNTFSFYSVDLL